MILVQSTLFWNRVVFVVVVYLCVPGKRVRTDVKLRDRLPERVDHRVNERGKDFYWFEKDR